MAGEYGGGVKSSFPATTLSLLPVLGGILADLWRAARQNGGHSRLSAALLAVPIILVRSDSELFGGSVTGQTTFCDCRTTWADSICG